MSGESVVALVSSLADALCPSMAPAQRDTVLDFSMGVLGSLMGTGSTDGSALWTVADRVHRRLAARTAAAPPAGALDDPAARFQVLRGKLATSSVVTHKAQVLSLLLRVAEHRAVGASAVVQPPTLPAIRKPVAEVPLAPQVPPAGASPPAAPTPPVGDAKVTHYSAGGLPFAVSEALLIRDLVFVFEGIDGQFVRFDPARDAFHMPAGVCPGVPLSTRGLVARLGELGWLYTRVAGFLERPPDALPSLVREALCAALRDEITVYFGELAALGAQVNPAPGGDDDASQAGLTLRRLWVWAQQPLAKLRLMAALVDSAGDLRGGALASAVQLHAVHGDPAVAHFSQRVLGRLCVRLVEMTRAWLLAGELTDDHGEFFIQRHTVEDSRMWADRFTLRESMLPSFVGRELAAEVLLIGKSINFIRSSCGDREWLMTHDAAPADVGTGDGLVADLRAVTAAVGPQVNRRLLHLLFTDFHLLDHLQALKRYLLLGQGDFITLLMETLAPELDRPAARQMHHTLAACLEGALRSSNAQFETKDVLERLDVHCDPSGDGVEDSGWDVFSLTYHVGEPLSAVVTADHMQTYLRVFSFLWRLRRVEFTLSNTWCRHMTAANKLRAHPVMRTVLHKCHLLRNEMLTFSSTLMSYVMFEVLEIAWAELTKRLKAATSMADITKAHDQYLATILTKQFMSETTASVALPLQALLDEALRFAHMQEQLYARALAEAAQLERHETAMEHRTAAGGWGTSTSLESSEGAEHAARAIESLTGEYLPRVEEIAATFRGLMFELLEILDKGSAEVEEFRFLAFRIDFNAFYRRTAANSAPVATHSVP